MDLQRLISNILLEIDSGHVYEHELGWTHGGHIPLHVITPDVFEDITTVPQAPQVERAKKTIGQEAEIQNLYEGPRKCKCCINWVEKPPTQVPDESAEKYSRAAITIYRSKDHEANEKTVGGLTALTIDSIKIQSPYLIAAIAPLMEDIGMPIANKEVLGYRAPFKELYFMHPKILDLARQVENDSDEGQHLNVLINVLNEVFGEIGPEIAQLHADKTITCVHLWTLFPKGILVYARINDQDRIFEVVSVVHYSGCHHWTMRLRYVQFNGIEFGFTITKLAIHDFPGTQKITDLPVYPLGFHGDSDLKTRLAQRGEQVLAFQDTSNHEYDGVAGGVRYADNWEDDEDDDKTYQSHQKYHVRH